jgi:hypothetical protein
MKSVHDVVLLTILKGGTKTWHCVWHREDMTPLAAAASGITRLKVVRCWFFVMLPLPPDNGPLC